MEPLCFDVEQVAHIRTVIGTDLGLGEWQWETDQANGEDGKRRF